MEHRSSVIVLGSNAINNNNDDEKMNPNGVIEEAAEKKDEPCKEKLGKKEYLKTVRKKEAPKKTVCNCKKEAPKKIVRKKEALKKAVHKKDPLKFKVMKKQAMKQKVLKKDLVPMLLWQIQEIVVKFNLHKKESKLLPTEQMFPKKELLFREERVLKNELATL